MAYFPMFVDLTDQPCLVVGGGAVALRKIIKLREFGAQVTVVAPELLPEMEGLACCIRREFRDTDPDDKYLVIAATNDSSINHAIADICKAKRIPVNAVDQQEDCTFIFPSIIREGDLVAGFSSSGKSPMITQYLKEQELSILTPKLAAINDLMGEWRGYMKAHYRTEQERKIVYKRIFDYCMALETLPDAAEIEKLL